MCTFVLVCVCIYVYMYVYTWYMYMYVCMYIHINVSCHSPSYTYIFISDYTGIHICSYKYMCHQHMYYCMCMNIFFYPPFVPIPWTHSHEWHHSFMCRFGACMCDIANVYVHTQSSLSMFVVLCSVSVLQRVYVAVCLCRSISPVLVQYQSWNGAFI